MYENVGIEVEDGVLTVTMNRAEKKNALTAEMYACMAEALSDADDNPKVRVILITGAGGSFTAGNDLGDFLKTPPVEHSAPVYRFITMLPRLLKPMVAAVEGVAVGIGTTMLLHCDLAYAAHGTRFMLPFINLGLVPEAGSSLLLPRMVGHQRAAELLMLGETFGAERARELGIINAVCEPAHLMDTAREAAAKLAAKPSRALLATKALLKRGDERVATRIAVEANEFRERLVSREAKDTISAFLKRGKPK